jgi:cyclohexanone monooxygenase
VTETVEGLRKKYAEERDKRVRADGNAQYIPVEGRFAHFGDDPLAERPAHRDPEIGEVEVLVVGGGISGLLTGAALRTEGIDDFRIVEKAADFGGTWYWNRYPGLTCDCESYIYLPLLEELDYVPTEKYARGSEISGHCRAISQKYALYDNALLQTEVTEINWSEADHRWIATTDCGDALRARFVILGSGPLNRPKLPGIAGIENFSGRQFHTSRWDYGYTGGSPSGGMDGLRDKRVALVGTGATAIQCVPYLARDAEHLYVVQRTPSIVDARENGPTDEAWAAGLAPGWQRRRMENFDSILAGVPQDEDLVGDRWTQIWGGGAQALTARSPEAATAILERLDVEQMERIRARVDAEVEDPTTAELLKPYYGRHCKRPCFSDDYLKTFNRPNVTLVDTDGKGLDRITENAIVTNGRTYEVDCIIYATGFEFGVASTRSGGFEVFGPGGASLSETRATGVHSLHGIHLGGFPNLFVIGGLHHAGVSVNIPYVFGGQSRHVAALIGQFLGSGVDRAEVRPEAQERWAKTIAAKSVYNDAASRGCTPGFYNNENSFAAAPNVFATAYGGGPAEYLEALREWCASSVDDDFSLVRGEAATLQASALRDDPRADPRMIAALAPFGLGGHQAPPPVSPTG